MKLRTKLLLAPLLTAAVVLAAGQANSLYQARQATAAQAGFEHQLAVYKALNAKLNDLARAHADVYRTFVLMASYDEAKIKAFRGDLARRLGEVQQALATVAKDNEGNAPVMQLATPFFPWSPPRSDRARG